MARVLEAEARISATDRTGNVFERIAGKINAVNRAAGAAQGVSGKLAAFEKKTEAVGKKVTVVGRGLTLGATIPAAAAGRSVLHSLRGFELAANKLKAFGDMTSEEVKAARELAKQYGQNYTFGPAGVLAGMVEQIKAGFKPEHLKAIQQPLLDFATIAEIDIPKASELAIAALSGFDKLVGKDGKLLEGSQLNVNLRQMVDLFAILNKVAPGSIEQIAETFKYSAAAAAQLKVAPEQLGAFTAVLAQAGILGPEAGVALRSMLVRFIKPTRPALAAMSAIGMKLDDYVIKNPALLKSDNMLSAIEQQTGTLDPRQRKRFLADAGKLQGLEGEDFEKGLIAAIRRIGKGDLKDAETAGDLATRIMGTAIEKIDIMRFLKDAAKLAPNFAAFMATMMDQRQAVRLANLNNERVITVLGEIQAEIAKAARDGTSVARRQAGEINAGLIEAMNKLGGGLQNMVLAFGEAGAVDAAVNSMNALSSGVKSIAELNPKILEFSTYAAGAAVAIGPLLWVIGKLSSAGAVLSKLIMAVAPAATNPVVAGGALAIGAGGLLHDETKQYEGKTVGERLKEKRGGRSMRDTYRGSFNPDRERLNLPPLEAAPPAPVKAEVEGKADVNVNVKIEPSPDFWTQVRTTVSNAINAARVNGVPPAGTAGSTGVAMPEAGPIP